MRFIHVFCLILLVLPNVGFARDRVLDIQLVESEKADITAWLVEDHSVPVIAIHFAFRGAGSIQDPLDKQGLVRMASSTIDQGAGYLDSKAFQEELNTDSISMRFSANRDHFSGTLKTLTRSRSKAFSLLSQALSQPRFDEEPVERMRSG